MARKNERRKVGDRRAADRGGKRVAKPAAKAPKVAKVPEPPPQPKIKFRGKLL